MNWENFCHMGEWGVGSGRMAKQGENGEAGGAGGAGEKKLITNNQYPMPNAQCPMPNAQCPITNLL
ncbi:hypothetical protein [Nostoc sp.]|uniref:hypothetical protein n=1 Tax=Nostoc sp. TaxID=1180 RepID=UPI002FF8925C